MARGWESKSVEDQMAEAEARKLTAATPKLSAAEIERRDKVAALQLSRSHLLEQLTRVRSAAHQQMLERALAEIEAQLAAHELPSA
ncbi:MAG: hypothetical protein U0Y68_26900 [Blastocatellia bacterium]